MVLVDNPEKTATDKPPRKRDRTAERARAKARATSEKSEVETAAFIRDNLSPLLVAVFGFMAAKLHPIWAITPEEADSVAEPASKIIGRLASAELAEKYGDYIALAVALSIVIMPRLMIWAAAGKERKAQNGHNNRQPVEGNGNAKKPIEERTGQLERGTTTAAAHQSPVKDLITELTDTGF